MGAHRFPTAIALAVTFLKVQAVRTSSVELFDFEKIQLGGSHEDRDVAIPQAAAAPCKAFPGDADWPSPDTWAALNDTMDGALLKPAPFASVCYRDTVYRDYDNATCAAASAAWSSLAR